MIGSSIVAWVVAFVAGGVVSAGLWIALRETFCQPLFLRRNFRGVDVPVGAGVVVGFALISVWGVWRFVAVARRSVDLSLASFPAVGALVAGFALLGLFDDLAAQGDDRGFRGHLGALAQGRLTTGGCKLLGGGLLALAVTATSPMVGGIEDWWRILLGAAVVALAANTGNLLDRAPARCAKVALVCGVALLATCGAPERWTLVGVVIVLGATAGLIVFDAREQLMLGDAGSNVVGAALGWGLVVTTDWLAQVIVLVVLVMLNVASEKVSFSKVIDDVAVLRAIDRFGRS